jgi:hypothetical protein
MSVLDQAQRLKTGGKLAEAVALIEKAAREGEARPSTRSRIGGCSEWGGSAIPAPRMPTA